MNWRTLLLLGVITILLFSCKPLSEENTFQETTSIVKQVTGEPSSPTALPEENLDTVYINNRRLTAEQLQELTAVYGVPPIPGRYWHDSLSGSYGIWHGSSLGVILASPDFGPVPEDASNGNTGVFINGRELPETDVLFLELIFNVPRQSGRYWQDALGNIGYEGDPTPLVNLYVAYQQRTRLSAFYGSDDNYWAGNFASYGNEQNGFGYVMVNGVSVTYGE